MESMKIVTEDATTASSVLDIEEVELGMLIITEIMPNPNAVEFVGGGLKSTTMQTVRSISTA